MENNNDNKYELMTKPELIELCRNNGLPVSGKKADLISRLEAADQSTGETAEVEAQAETNASTVLPWHRKTDGGMTMDRLPNGVYVVKKARFSLDERLVRGTSDKEIIVRGRYEVEDKDGEKQIWNKQYSCSNYGLLARIFGEETDEIDEGMPVYRSKIVDEGEHFLIANKNHETYQGFWVCGSTAYQTKYGDPTGAIKSGALLRVTFWQAVLHLVKETEGMNNQMHTIAEFLVGVGAEPMYLRNTAGKSPTFVGRFKMPETASDPFAGIVLS